MPDPFHSCPQSMPGWAYWSWCTLVSCPFLNFPSAPPHPHPSKGGYGFETVFVGVCILCCDMVYYRLNYHSSLVVSLESTKGVAALTTKHFFPASPGTITEDTEHVFMQHDSGATSHMGTTAWNTQKLCVKKLSFRDFLILRFEVKHSDTVSLFWSLFTVNILHSYSRFLSINIWFSSYYKTTVIYYKLLPLLPVHLHSCMCIHSSLHALL